MGELVVDLLIVAVSLPAVLLAVRVVGRRTAGTVSSVAGRVRWRWMGTCLLVAFPAIMLMLGGMWAALALTSDESLVGEWAFPGWPAFLAALVIIALLVPMQAAAEEYMFRGWLLQAVGAFVRRPWLPIGLQALVFAAAHGWGTGWGSAGLLMTGVVAGLLAVRTGGLESYIALHTMNNLFAFTLAAAAGELADESNAADMPWHMTVVMVAVDVAYAAAVLTLVRRRGLTTAAPPVAAPVPIALEGPAATAEPAIN